MAFEQLAKGPKVQTAWLVTFYCALSSILTALVAGIWSYENGMNGLSAASLAAFTRPKCQGGLGWSVDEVEVFLTDVRKDLKDVKIHAYCSM